MLSERIDSITENSCRLSRDHQRRQHTVHILILLALANTIQPNRVLLELEATSMFKLPPMIRGTPISARRLLSCRPTSITSAPRPPEDEMLLVLSSWISPRHAAVVPAQPPRHSPCSPLSLKKPSPALPLLCSLLCSAL